MTAFGLTPVRERAQKSTSSRRALQSVVLIAITLLSTGVAFPIYGSPVITGIGRLTVFRVGLLLLLIASPLWLRELRTIVQDGSIRVLLLFAAVRAVSLIWSPGATWGIVQIRWFFESLICLLALIGCARAWTSSFRYLYRALLVAGGISALTVCLQYFEFRTTGVVRVFPFALSSLGLQTIPDDGWYPLGQDGRILGGFEEPNLTGSFMVYVMCLALPAALFGQKRSLRIAGWIIFLLCSTGVVASASRQSMVVMAVVVVTVAVRAWKTHPAMSVVLIGALGAGSWYMYFMITRVFQTVGIDPQSAVVLARFAKSAETGDISGGRLDWYGRAFATLGVDTFLLGHGEGAAFSLDVITVHNAFVTVLVENGIWALALLVIAIAMMLWNARPGRTDLAAMLPQASIEAGFLITIAWAILIGLNWAQLNQFYAWPFLALGFGALAIPAPESHARHGL